MPAEEAEQMTTHTTNKKGLESKEMNVLELITAIASTATAIGVIIAVMELWHTERIAKTEFEDQFRRDYRDICSNLPVKAFLGHSFSDSELDSSLGDFHQYFHLCNSQMFLRAQGKISPPTWKMWASGIESNFKLDAFQQAWDHLHDKANAHRLQYLNRFLISEGSDPKAAGLIAG